MSNPFVGRVVREKRHGELNLLDAETALRTLADPAGHVEIRPLPAALSRSILPGSDVAGLLLAASKAEYAGNTVYLTLNPVTPKQHGSSKDPDVTCYRWLFVDVDPIREHGRERESATDAEKAQAAAVALAIADWLTDQDWPEPVQVDSGNGYYLLYRVDLPNNAQSRQILKDVLAVLGGQHDTAGAGVDRKVHNASRIAKLPGSWSRKGANSPERPWRQSCLLRVPETVGVVTVEQLQAVAGLGKTVSPSTPTPLPAALAGHKKTGDGGAAYLRAVLDRECRRILLAIPGHPKEGRNNALFRAACNVGEFVASGAITHHEAHARLLEAALHAGLEERESVRTIASAFERTATKPRTVPDRNAEPSKNGRPPSPQQAGTDPTTEAETPEVLWTVEADGEVLAAGGREVLLCDGDVLDDGPRRRCLRLYTIGHLRKIDFPPTVWVVPGIVSQGVTLLAASPKVGKSLLSLNVAMTCAGGGVGLSGSRIDPADCLYLSLEDPFRRVKGRVLKMLPGLPTAGRDEIDRRLTVAEDWPRLDEGGLSALEHWRRRVDAPRLIVFDVWNRLASVQSQSSGNAYFRDAAAVAEVKRYADRHNLGILIVHHTRKRGANQAATDDFVAEISGTLGLAGSADNIMVMTRCRHESEAELEITGRDVISEKLVLEFDDKTLVWKSLGTKADHLKGVVQQAIVQYLRGLSGKAAFSKEIAAATGHKENSIYQAATRLYEQKLIRKVGYAWAYPGEPDAAHDARRAASGERETQEDDDGPAFDVF